MKDIQVLLVVETNPSVRSDDAYYAWILKNHFGNYVLSQGFDGLRITYNFVYMDGKTNYKQKWVEHDILIAKEGFSRLGSTFVVYCFDVDNGTKTNARFMEGVESYCKKKGYLISIANKEIEDVFEIYGGSKSERAVRFSKNYPKKSSLSRNRFFTLRNNVSKSTGRTNFGLVIQSIIDHAQEK